MADFKKATEGVCTHSGTHSGVHTWDMPPRPSPGRSKSHDNRERGASSRQADDLTSLLPCKMPVPAKTEGERGVTREGNAR